MYYPLNVLFMGQMLYVKLDPGVYGENEHRVREQLEQLEKRFKDMLAERDWLRF